MKVKRDRWGHPRGGKCPLKGDKGLPGADTGTRWVPVSLTEIRGKGGESGLLGSFQFPGFVTLFTHVRTFLI